MPKRPQLPPTPAARPERPTEKPLKRSVKKRNKPVPPRLEMSEEEKAELKRLIAISDEEDTKDHTPIIGFDSVADTWDDEAAQAQAAARRRRAAQPVVEEDDDEDDFEDEEDDDEDENEWDDDDIDEDDEDEDEEDDFDDFDEEDDVDEEAVPEAPAPQRNWSEWLDLGDVRENGQRKYPHLRGNKMRVRLDQSIEFLRAAEQLRDAARAARKASRRTGQKVPPRVRIELLQVLLEDLVVDFNYKNDYGYRLPKPSRGGVRKLRGDLLFATFDRAMQELAVPNPTKKRSTKR